MFSSCLLVRIYFSEVAVRFENASCLLFFFTPHPSVPSIPRVNVKFKIYVYT